MGQSVVRFISSNCRKPEKHDWEVYDGREKETKRDDRRGAGVNAEKQY